MRSPAGKFDINQSSLYFGVTNIIFGFAYLFVNPEPFDIPLDSSLLWLLAACFVGYLVQNFMVSSIQLDSPANAMLVCNSNLFIALIGDWAIFGKEITVPKVLGSMIMLGSLVMLTRYKSAK